MAQKRKTAVKTAAANKQMPVIPIEGKMRLSQLFSGSDMQITRSKILEQGYVDAPRGNKRLYVQTRPVEGGDHEIMAIAAVSRDPGRTQDYIDAIDDFRPTATGTNKKNEIDQFWKIYESEALVNNSVNKLSAILSAGGRYRVRGGKRGKVRNATEQAQQILDFFVRNVNNAPVDGVITGSRGIKAVTQQGVRQALVEGDWFGRAAWVKAQVGTLGKFDLPMVIQSITSAQIEPVKELAGLGPDLYYWVPPSTLITQLSRPATKEIGDVLKKFIPKELQGPLQKDRKVLLDPALLLHVKHRGTDSKSFGESLITPAKHAIAFKRSLEALDFVTISNLINRITIVMVGSSDPNSPYSDENVALQRAALMQQFFEDPGPNMTIVWHGDDVKVEDVGAHSVMATTDSMHKMAESKLKSALGVPEALLTGSTTDGKAAGWAATIGAAAQLEELRTAFQNAWTTLGERILTENNFTDIDIIFEFDNSLMVDKAEEANQYRLDYVNGSIGIKTYLTARGIDADAEFIQRCKEQDLDPNSTTWAEAFIPVAGLQGQGIGAGAGGEEEEPPKKKPAELPGQGRTPDSQQGKPTKKPAERKRTTENK